MRRAWAGWVLLAGLSLFSTACTTLALSDQAAAPEWVTDSDEPEVRRRARLRTELASAYWEQGKATVALDEVKQALVADPTYAPAYELRGLIYLQLKDWRLAEANLQQALKWTPQDGHAWHNWAWLQCETAHYAEAETAFTKALQSPRYPAAAKTWMSQGVCQARAGQWVQAEHSFLRSLALDAEHPITKYHLAWVLSKQHQYQQAEPYIRQLNASAQVNAESLWLGVKIEHQLNNHTVVREWGEELQQRYPTSQEAAAYTRGAYDD